MTKVSQILEQKGRGFVAVAPETPVIDVLRKMAEHHIGAVLVMQGAQLVGIASERDYARKVVLLGRNSTDTAISKIMSSPVVTVSPSASVQDCMEQVTKSRIRHLPVMDDGQVVGVISIGDLVKAVIEEQQREIEQLQQYIAS